MSDANNTFSTGAETMSNNIMSFDGKYEVHPAADEQSWCVVNSETGQVRNDGLAKYNACQLATELNGAEQMTQYMIEGNVSGQWDEDNVTASGDPADVNRFETEESALSALEELVDVFAGQYETEQECRDNLRVVECE